MRRAAVSLIATVIGLVLLLGFKTGPRGHGGGQAVALAPAKTGRPANTVIHQAPVDGPRPPAGPIDSAEKDREESAGA